MPSFNYPEKKGLDGIKVACSLLKPQIGAQETYWGNDRTVCKSLGGNHAYYRKSL